MLTEADLHNVLALIDFGFKNGIVTSQDHAKVLLVLDEKIKAILNPATEDTDGDDSPSTAE